MRLQNDNNPAGEASEDDGGDADRVTRLKNLRRSMAEGDAPVRPTRGVAEILRQRLKVAEEAVSATSSEDEASDEPVGSDEMLAEMDPDTGFEEAEVAEDAQDFAADVEIDDAADDAADGGAPDEDTLDQSSLEEVEAEASNDNLAMLRPVESENSLEENLADEAPVEEIDPFEAFEAEPDADVAEIEPAMDAEMDDTDDEPASDSGFSAISLISQLKAQVKTEKDAPQAVDPSSDRVASAAENVVSVLHAFQKDTSDEDAHESDQLEPEDTADFEDVVQDPVDQNGSEPDADMSGDTLADAGDDFDAETVQLDEASDTPLDETVDAVSEASFENDVAPEDEIETVDETVAETDEGASNTFNLSDLEAIQAVEAVELQSSLPHAAEPVVKEPTQADVDLAAALLGQNQSRTPRSRKTRVLGFDNSETSFDPFAETAEATQASASVKFPVGWIVISDGPGRGESFPLTGGAAQIGRGEGQTIRLDFGDTSISRENHAAIAYDEQENQFVLAQGGKSNLVRLNGRPVLSNETLNHGDTLRIGETRLRFVALCGGDFSWGETE